MSEIIKYFSNVLLYEDYRACEVIASPLYSWYYPNMNSAIAKKNKLSSATQNLIVRAVHEVLSDPDFGLELTDRAKRRLLLTKEFKGKGVSFSEIKKKYA